MRRTHYIKRNTKMEAPQSVIYVDTESRNEKGKMGSGAHRLWFGCATHDRWIRQRGRVDEVTESTTFTTPEAFWEWVEQRAVPKQRTWVMAHNSNFDMAILNTSNILKRNGWVCHKYINEKPPVIIHMMKGDKGILIVDSLNWFRTSVDSLGKAMGLAKLAMPQCECLCDDWLAYCKRDVEVVRLAFRKLREFVIEQDLGVFAPTLAGQAMNAFRHRFMHNDILVHNNVSALELERDAFHGGRCDAFYYGKVTEKLYKLDINSMYPTIMFNEKMPLRFVRYHRNASMTLLTTSLKAYDVIARVQVDTPEPCYARVLNNRLVFPVGRFETVLCTPELKYAIANGHIKRVKEMADYESEVAFDTFVDYFYTERLRYASEGNEAFKYMCKILMNSLYGKWGQSGRKWTESDTHMIPNARVALELDLPSGEMVKLRNRLGKCQEFKTEPESENSCPAIAAMITAYARMQLWNYIKETGEENVYYVDTDSIITTERGVANLAGSIHPTLLGKLKLEGTSSDSAFYAPKDYRFDGHDTIKGIKASAQELERGVYLQPQFQSWDTAMKEGTDGVIKITDRPKILGRENNKRVVKGSGWNKPIILGEW